MSREVQFFTSNFDNQGITSRTGFTRRYWTTQKDIKLFFLPVSMGYPQLKRKKNAFNHNTSRYLEYVLNTINTSWCSSCVSSSLILVPQYDVQTSGEVVGGWYDATQEGWNRSSAAMMKTHCLYHWGNQVENLWNAIAFYLCLKYINRR